MSVKSEAYLQYDKIKNEETVREYLPLVYKIARQVANATALGSLDYNDLVSSGVIGLYKAIGKFDKSKGFTFGTFAAHYVKGSMLDELAKHRQIPRGLRDKQKKIKTAFESLEQTLMIEPSDEQVADYLTITVDEYHHWLVDLGWTSAWSLEDLEAAGSFHVADDDVNVNPLSASDSKETKSQLMAAIRRLPERDQKVLYLYYQEELTLKEIAYVLDLSESQISRIHSKAVLRLRHWMETG